MATAIKKFQKVSNKTWLLPLCFLRLLITLHFTATVLCPALLALKAQHVAIGICDDLYDRSTAVVTLALTHFNVNSKGGLTWLSAVRPFKFFFWRRLGHET